MNLFRQRPPDAPPWWANEIYKRQGLILKNLETIMATLDQVLKDVTDESTQLDGISTLVSGLQQQVKDALANSSVSPADQAKIDQIFTQAESNKQKILNALVSGTPADQAAQGSAPAGT
jgi:predicted metal-dependent enzyme (double-stranded beta helix superfamily)